MSASNLVMEITASVIMRLGQEAEISGVLEL